KVRSVGVLVSTGINIEDLRPVQTDIFVGDDGEIEFLADVRIMREGASGIARRVEAISGNPSNVDFWKFAPKRDEILGLLRRISIWGCQRIPITHPLLNSSLQTRQCLGSCESYER